MIRSSRRPLKAGQIVIDWIAVGRRLRELRGFDTTQQEFAEHIGISQNYLSMMERGKVEIGAEILLRIASAHGKSIEWLLTGKDRHCSQRPISDR
jgi:transcriptional regulator with XRE-family HTH domain